MAFVPGIVLIVWSEMRGGEGTRIIAILPVYSGELHCDASSAAIALRDLARAQLLCISLRCRFQANPVREGFEPSDIPHRLFDAGLPMRKLSLVVDVISVLLVKILVIGLHPSIDTTIRLSGIAASMSLVANSSGPLNKRTDATRLSLRENWKARCAAMR